MAKRRPQAVVFHSYPKLLFCWPLIVLGFALFFIAGPRPAAEPAPAEQDTGVAAPADSADQAAPAADEPAEAAAAPTSRKLAILGWVYLLTAALVVITLGIDIERNTAVFWLVTFLLFVFLGMWLQDSRGFTLFGDVFNWFAALDIQYDRGFGLAMSCLLSVPYVVMILWARVQHRWRITHNEFEHFSWGRADDSLARGAKRVRSSYPDLLELVLAGAGTLIVYSATGRSELRRIPHVPMLPLLRKRIDRILSMTAVTGMHRAVAESEMEEDEAEIRIAESAEPIGDEKL